MYWLLLTLAHAVCPEAATVESVLGALTAAEQAFAAGDAGAFASRTSAARAALPCLREPVGPALAAAWHRNGALDAMVMLEADDRPVVLAALSAMLASDPSYRLPAALAPQGSLLPVWLEEARARGAGPGAPLLAPERTRVLLDGRDATERPEDRPLIVQLQWEGSAEVRYTAALAPGEALPDWAALGLLPPAPGATVARLGRPATLGLSGGALACAALSGVFLGFGYANREQFLALETNEGAEELIARSRRYSVAGAISAAGAVGLGAAVVLRGEL